MTADSNREKIMKANGSAQSVSPRSRWLRASQARVDGQVVEVTANIYGRVGCVLTSEDQIVEKGDVLVELDHRQLDRNLEAAAIELKLAVAASMTACGPCWLLSLSATLAVSSALSAAPSSCW